MKTQAMRGYNIPDTNPGWSAKVGDCLVEVFDMRGDAKMCARITQKNGTMIEGLVDSSAVTEDSRDFGSVEAQAIMDTLTAPVVPPPKPAPVPQAPNPMIVPPPLR